MALIGGQLGLQILLLNSNLINVLSILNEVISALRVKCNVSFTVRLNDVYHLKLEFKIF